MEEDLKKLADALDSDNPKLKQSAEKAYNNIKAIAGGKDQQKAEEAKKVILLVELYRKNKKVNKHAHGAKLNYIKTLKHVCPEGLELYYYKQGGNLQCGCKGKKMEEGAKVEEAKCGAVAKFKKVKKGLDGPKNTLKFRDLAARDSFYINTYGAEDLESTRPGKNIPNKNYNPNDPNSKTHTWVPDRTKEPYNKQKELPEQKLKPKPVLSKPQNRRVEPLEPKPKQKSRLNSSKPSKGDSSHVNKLTSLLKKGGAVDAFKAKCGSKMKKHKLGGSLNRIPFYLEGTNKGGLKPIVLPEYKILTGTPTILPGRYTGLERMTPGLLQMFKTWIKGLPKSLSTSDKVTIGTGTVLGNVLGYDDTHNLNIRKTANKIANKISPLIESSIEYRPFSVDRLIESTFKPKNPSFKEFKK